MSNVLINTALPVALGPGWSIGPVGSVFAPTLFGTRASRLLAGIPTSGVMWKETDTQWVYYSDGAAWNFFSGIYVGLDSDRLAISPTSADDGAVFVTTDTELFWYVTGAAWVSVSFGGGGGGGGAMQSLQLTPDGVTTAFTLPIAPVGGILLWNGVTQDLANFSFSGTTLNTGFTAASTDSLLIYFWGAGSGFANAQQLSPDGITHTFTLSSAPTGVALLAWNGITADLSQYSISGTTLTTIFLAGAADSLLIYY